MEYCYKLIEINEGTSVVDSKDSKPLLHMHNNLMHLLDSYLYSYSRFVHNIHSLVYRDHDNSIVVVHRQVHHTQVLVHNLHCCSRHCSE